MNSSRNHSEEMQLTYLGAFPHTLFTAFIWVLAGIVGLYLTPSGTILFFLVAGTFVFPGGELIRKIMQVPNVLSPDNKLPQLFTWMAFTLPLSYPLIYLACKNDINLFFPAFTILVGAHYLPFIYGYGMPSFGLLSVLLVLLGTYLSLRPTGFTLPALVTGSVLFLFAFIHLFLLKRNQK